MDFLAGCLICGSDLIYSPQASSEQCHLCGVTETTNTRCSNEHYVCDRCHSGSGNDLIERYCINTDSTAPLAMALELMHSPALKLHGPEHHFLVPAVLLASCFNRNGTAKDVLEEKIRQARRRAEEVKGGFCGLQGACGATIGAGIFVSVMTGSTPLSDRERRLANLMTAECLRVVAENCGPRCCKREVFWTIRTAVEFIRRELGVALSLEPLPSCTFSSGNSECIQERCRFYGI